MKICDRYGAELMHIKSLQKKGDDFIMKGKMMGHIPTSVYLKPEQFVNAIGLLSWSTFLHVPVMLCKGLWRKVMAKRD